MAISHFFHLTLRRVLVASVVFVALVIGVIELRTALNDGKRSKSQFSDSTLPANFYSSDKEPRLERDVPEPRIEPYKFIVKLQPVGNPSLAGRASPGSLVMKPDGYQPLQLSLDVVSLAKAARPTDLRLVNWLIRWEKNIADDKQVTDEDRKDLTAILKDTPLSGVSLFKIGDSFYSAANDLHTTCVFYKAAVFNGHAEVAKLDPSSPIIRSFLAAGPKARAMLWVLHDQDLDHECAEALYTFNSDLVHYLKPKDSTMENARQHGYIGILEYFMIEGRYKDGVAFAKTVDTASMNEEQRVSFAWAYGRVLEGNSQYAEAVPELRRVLTDTHFKYHDNVYSYLIWALVGSGQTARAEPVLAEGIAIRGLDGRMQASAEFIKAGQLAADLKVQWP